MSRNIWSNKKKTKKIDLRVFTHSCQLICSNCASGCWKNTNLKRKIARKVLETLRKVRDNKRNLLKRPESLFDIRKNSKYRDSRYREFFALIKCYMTMWPDKLFEIEQSSRYWVFEIRTVNCSCKIVQHKVVFQWNNNC